MTSNVRFVQISDTHLYAEKSTLHHNANVYENLCRVLADINKLNDVAFILFTGDLTQDHSIESYQNFVDAFKENYITIPTYFLAGNHDEHEHLNQHLDTQPFCDDILIEQEHWQVLLLSSKSETPAGFIKINDSNELVINKYSTKHQIAFMHHHPVDVGYFIDRHGLQNKQEFYHLVDECQNLKAVGCGHIHNAFELSLKTNHRQVPVYSCPATSIQFDVNKPTVFNSGKPAGYRLFQLYDDGTIHSEAIFINE